MKELRGQIVEIIIDRTQGGAGVLGFLQLGQRHFEKEIPDTVYGGPESGIFVYRLPVDLIGMVTQSQPGLLDSVEEVLVTYVKKKT